MTDPEEQRRTFITELYRCGDKLESQGHDSAEARKTLAALRRSLTRPYEPTAVQVVVNHNPPAREESVWLLVAGLHALHPSPHTAPEQRLSLGAALAHIGSHQPVERRLQQLVSIAPESLPHYLRQAVQLLKQKGIPLNFASLLSDLVELEAQPPNSRAAHRVRMRWATSYHRTRVHLEPKSTADTDESSEGATA